jgi:methanethiol S-methyltransferase
MLAIGFGSLAYVFFLLTLLYVIGFVGNRFVPKSIDSGPTGPVLHAVLVDVLLLSLFALQHSVMARQGFKRWWTRFCPPVIERSAYVLMASATLALLCWQWIAIPHPIWAIAQPVLRAILHGLFWAGWAMVVGATYLINHFELFGLQQVFSAGRSVDAAGAEAVNFRTPGLYKLVRHPIYLGFLIAFWATPDMSAGHLLFSIATSLYILLGLSLEERDLVRTLGDRYRQYQREVRALIPIPKRVSRAAEPRSTDRGPDA